MAVDANAATLARTTPPLSLAVFLSTSILRHPATAKSLQFASLVGFSLFVHIMHL